MNFNDTVSVEMTLGDVYRTIDKLRHSRSEGARAYRRTLLAAVEVPPLRCPRTFPHKECGAFEDAADLAGHLRYVHGTLDREAAAAEATAAEAAWVEGIDKAKARKDNVVAGNHPDAGLYASEDEDEDEELEEEEEEDDEE